MVTKEAYLFFPVISYGFYLTSLTMPCHAKHFYKIKGKIVILFKNSLFIIL